MGNKRTSVIWTIPKEELSRIVKESSSYTAVLKFFGLESKGANNETLKKRLNEERIDYSHIKENKYKFSAKRIIPDKEIFKKNSKVSQSVLKRRILRNNMLAYQCSECGIGPEWCGKPLTLQLDHKNGNRTDNRLENLRFLCPNCHAQTPNFAGGLSPEIKSKNKQKKLERELERGRQLGRYCEQCGGPLRPSQEQFCSKKCRGKDARKSSKSPSKEDLEKDIKNMSFVRIGKKYGVSDNTIRKWAKYHGIPFKDITSPRTPALKVKIFKIKCYCCSEVKEVPEGEINRRIKTKSRGYFCGVPCYREYQSKLKSKEWEKAPFIQDVVGPDSEYYIEEFVTKR